MDFIQEIFRPLRTKVLFLGLRSYNVADRQIALYKLTG